MEILTIVLPLFLVMGLGALGVWTKVFKSEDSHIFSRYDYYVGFPILIFYSLSHTDFQKITNLPFLATNVINLLIMVALVLVGAYVFRLKRKLIGIAVIAAVYGNVAYMGIPLNELLFGQEGIGYASIVVGVVSIFALSVGIFLLEFYTRAKPNLRNIFLDIVKNPLVVAILLGVVASGFHVNFPLPLDSFFNIVSKSASPIALFAIGMFLVGKRHVFTQHKLYIILGVLNLLLLPLITYVVGRLFGLTGVPFEVSVLQAAMPLAATNFILAEKYKIGEDIVATAIIVSTLASIITLSAWIILPGLLGL